MVNGINWNPFTQQPLTAEDIEQLDTNFDGVVTQEEFDAGYDPNWISTNDTEGAAAIGTDDPVTKSAIAAGMSQTAKNESELRTNINILMDEFLGAYFTENIGMPDSERSYVQQLVTTLTNKFITEQVSANPTGPYNMLELAPLFQDSIESGIKENKEALAATNAAMNGYVDNMSTNYDKMLSYAREGSADNYLKDSEWNQIRNSAVQYLMGSLISGQVDTDLLLEINPSYQKNSYYKEALSLSIQLKSCQDPEQMKELLVKIQKAITNFLNQAGRTNVAGAIKDADAAKKEAVITERLDKLVNNWLESKITADMTDEQKAELKAFAQNEIGKYLATLAENENKPDNSTLNTLSTNVDSLASQFEKTLENNYIKFVETQKKVDKITSEILTVQDGLISTTDNAKSNGNISAEEKAQIVAAASDLILRQMMSGMTDLPFLAALNSGYKASSQYTDVLALVNKINAATTEEELNKYMAEALELLSKMINSYSVEKISTAVDFTRPLNADKAKDNAIKNSTIADDYNNNVSRCTGRGKQTEDRLEEIQDMAKQDIAAYAEALKAELKAQYGAAYDETQIDAIIASATNDTIALFTQNVYRTKWKNDGYKYNVNNDNQAFVFKTHGSKGRYVYNVQSLINTFTSFFNEAAKTYKAQQNDRSSITYDKEDVIADSIGNDYNRDETIGSRQADKVRAEAKAKLQAVAASILSQLSSKGCNVPSSVIDTLLNESMEITLDKLPTETTKVFGTVVTHLSVKDVVDYFMETFDAKFAEVNEQY